MSFGIPTDPPAMPAGIDDATRLDAWTIAIEQAPDGATLAALEARLTKRLELLRAREWSPHVERAALAMIVERRQQLAEAQAKASREGAGGDRGPTMKE
jgi:hypothetical protein